MPLPLLACNELFINYCGYQWQVCIWDYYNRTKHTLMDNLEKTLDDANIQMDQDVRNPHNFSGALPPPPFSIFDVF
jgi:hypothetical protein